jgi:hypothetical protein
MGEAPAVEKARSLMRTPVWGNPRRADEFDGPPVDLSVGCSARRKTVWDWKRSRLQLHRYNDGRAPQFLKQSL